MWRTESERARLLRIETSFYWRKRVRRIAAAILAGRRLGSESVSPGQSPRVVAARQRSRRRPSGTGPSQAWGADGQWLASDTALT
jgi:hypothetical protein